MSKCKSCGAEIGFIKTSKGGNMPVDANEIATIVTADGITVRGRIAVINDAGEPIMGRVPHWSTCKSPDEFRRQ
ncbi:MAG: hypothetical protein Q8J63_00715 [Candidatus Aquicultor sp.]|nr:hypothetical protein [Candidatus Aquicultor sp.]